MSEFWLAPDQYSADLDLAADALGTQLYRGTLGLMLGAGTSKGLGLPNWWELVQLCRKEVGLPYETIHAETSNEDLRGMVDEIEGKVGEPTKYREVVRRSLYEGAKGEEHFLSQRLLIVLGAMMMKAQRGSIAQVITLNFDDILERYLRLHGFRNQTVVTLPCLLHSADVTIYHPHGFLPVDPAQDEGGRLIFSQYSYDQLLAPEVDPWRYLTKSLLLSRVVLFVGISRNDPELGPLLVGVKRELASAGNTRPIGFWLLRAGDDDKTKQWLLDRNVSPLVLPSYEEYPRFLLKVCQCAASHL
jgi:hypothetical protein